MKDVAIRAEGLGKVYRIGHKQVKYQTLRDTVAELALKRVRALGSGWTRNGKKETAVGTIWALKDVSFEVEPGEVVGIIGRNGAGKSTLLKILSRITEPTEGWVDLCGRVGSLLEVGTGFHGELTGRENIYLNGAILGMKRAEIARKFDEIVGFAEVENFIDTPVKHYSSGMYLRLAFAVAAHFEPEILLVDEVLAVGDISFQNKCLGKMKDVGRAGRTVIFVSHNMAALAKLTRRAFLIDRGRLIAQGATTDVISAYLGTDSSLQAEWRRNGRDTSSPVAILAVRVCDTTGETRAGFHAHQPFRVELEFSVVRATQAQLAFRLNQNSDGNTIFTSALSDALGERADYYPEGRYRASCFIPGHWLRPGAYHLLVAANNPTGPQHDLIEQALHFEITPVGSLADQDGRLGAIAPLLPWTVETVAKAPRPCSTSDI